VISLIPTTPPTAWAAPIVVAAALAVGGALSVSGRARSTGLASGASLARALFATTVLYAASGALPATNETRLVVLAVGALVLFRALDGSRTGAVLLAIGAIAGPLVEVALIRFGLFHYRDPDFLGIPLWSPALYACVLPATGQLARRALA
jgi:hypothetical protein